MAVRQNMGPRRLNMYTPEVWLFAPEKLPSQKVRIVFHPFIFSTFLNRFLCYFFLSCFCSKTVGFGGLVKWLCRYQYHIEYTKLLYIIVTIIIIITGPASCWHPIWILVLLLALGPEAFYYCYPLSTKKRWRFYLIPGNVQKNRESMPRKTSRLISTHRIHGTGIFTYMAILTVEVQMSKTCISAKQFLNCNQASVQ